MPDTPLRYLETLAREGSFSRAAARLEISQPSLSQFVQRLERDTGAELIDRSAHPLRLTHAGECFLETERQIQRLRESFAGRLADIDQGLSGHVTIGASQYRSMFFLTEVLPLMRSRYPGIEISLEEGTTKALEDFVLEGKTDISLVLSPVSSPELESEHLYDERQFLAMSAEHRLARHLAAGAPLPFSQLENEPFISIKRGQQLHLQFDSMCAASGVRPNVILESESPVSALMLASAGLGVTFTTETLARRCHTPHPVRFCETVPPLPVRHVIATYRRNRHLPRAARLLIEVMREVGRERFANG